MELFVLKLDQHAPCFSISEKAYALAYISDAMLLIFEVYIKKPHTKNRTNLTTTQSSKYIVVTKLELYFIEILYLSPLPHQA